MFPMVANAWQRHESVDFRGTGISESIQVRPSNNIANPAALADAHHAEALLIRDGLSLRGDRVVYRGWFNLAFGPEPWPYHSPNRTAAERELPNAWPQVHGPFEPTTLPEHMTAWWDAYNARTIANGTNPDYLVLDNEVRREFFYFATEAQRQAYFTPVTQPGFVVPGLAENPWIGQNIWTYGQPFTDGFIQFWSQWAADDLTAGLERLHGGMWSAPQVAAIEVATAERFGAVPENEELDARPISNYRDGKHTVSFGEVFNRPGRLPYAQTRISNISAPIAYFNRRINSGVALPQFVAEAEYQGSVRARNNRERFKSIVNRFNEIRSTNAVEPGDTHPWIQAPGWGWNGGEGWAPLVQLPFELVLWRAMMEHVAAHGISTVQLWNPIPPADQPSANDPHAATTHRFMAAWFTGRQVGPLVRDLPQIDLGTRVLTTAGIDGVVTTDYADLFEMQTVYFRRTTGAADTLAVPFLEGWPWSATDPLVVSRGPAGDAEVNAMLAAIANNQGTPVVAVEIENDTMPEQQVIEKSVTTFAKITADLLRGTPAQIGLTINPGEEDPEGFEGVRAQVRRTVNGDLVHDFSPDEDPIVLTEDDQGNLVFVRRASTAGWPEGKVCCDVFVVKDGEAYGVARYEWDIIASVTVTGGAAA